MRIGYDGTCLANRRGFGRFSRLLLEAIARQQSGHEIVVVVDRPSCQLIQIPESLDRLIVDVREAPSTAASSQGRRRLVDMLAMGRAVATSGLDLMYFPATYTFFPVWNVPRLVVTMHDTLALEHPELVFTTRKSRIAWLVKEHVAARLADRIVTVSETSLRALKAWLRMPASRFRVIGEGPDPIFAASQDGIAVEATLRRYGLTGQAPFLLYVGGLSPHKNLPRLIEAFGRVRDHGVRLVIVGDFSDVFHTHVPLIRETIAREALGDRVILTGFVPDHELVDLYRGAIALVQPSLMEGFGLPAVEAMACGRPVLSSRAGSLPEVIGDAGLFFDPTDVNSIAGTLNAFLADRTLRDDLARKALLRAAAFSWDRSAANLLDCFSEFDAGKVEQRQGLVIS
jgi:glycosyltransferase involved in cell wall biosynthesis